MGEHPAAGQADVQDNDDIAPAKAFRAFYNDPEGGRADKPSESKEVRDQHEKDQIDDAVSDDDLQDVVKQAEKILRNAADIEVADVEGTKATAEQLAKEAVDEAINNANVQPGRDRVDRLVAWAAADIELERRRKSKG